MKSTRILVIDDDPAVLHAMRRVLEPLYTLQCTNLPREASKLAASFNPDIAVCDIQMPEISGFQLLDSLRSAASDVDVILMTGSITDQDSHLIRALRERAFYFILKPFEREVLLALVERCEEMQRLRRSERGHLTRMKDELLSAQAFQQSMLAPLHDEVGGISVDVLWKPCSEVGGDFYDYTSTPGGDLAFILADVRGHGVPAALLTATVKTLFRSSALRDESPAQLAETLVESLRLFPEDQFMTAFCGRILRESNTLEYVNGGHPAGLVMSDDGAMELLHASGPLLSAMFEPGSWPVSETALPANAKLFLYTDGFHGGMRDLKSEMAMHVHRTIANGDNGQSRLSLLAESGVQAADSSHHLIDDVTLMLIERAAR